LTTYITGTLTERLYKMSNKSLIIDEDTGEVLDQTGLVPMSDGSSLRELIPYNRMTNIAKSSLTRLVWDKKKGLWQSSLGEFTDLELIPMAASEIYAVWSDVVGKPLYYGVSKEEAAPFGEVEEGYRIAFIEKTVGPAYADLFGMATDFAEAICKMGTNDKGKPIQVKGNESRSTSFGVLYVPRIVR
jgi:hypothetical protein